ncbi:hypothetical protein ABEF95_011750 [Exophiala dermatitidis]
MVSGSAPLAAQKRRRMPTQAKKAQTHRGSVSKATRVRRSPRITSAVKNSSQQRRRSLRLQGAEPIQTAPDSVQQAKTPKRPREGEVPPFRSSSEQLPKRLRTSAASVGERVGWETISEARVEYWSENGTWPTQEQEKTMDRFRDIVNHALARKRSGSLSRKRSNASLSTETAQTQTPSSQQPRDQKSAPYTHPLFEDQLKECGSLMDDYEGGIAARSERLCQMLLKAPQPPPEHTFFSDDSLFKKTCKRMRGANKTKVIRDIAQLIVPSAEILADKGAEHLEILRETTNACWLNAMPFLRPPGSRPAPRPQPDFGLGFKRDAFNREQLQKLQPYVGDPLADSSFVAATYNMYFPFLTSEVKCGATGLDIADRQNAHSQSVILHGLTTLFRLVGRENELNQEINGFSISHSDADVRIYGHYAVINEKDVRFYRHSIAEFNISPTAEGDQRWKAYTFVRNVYDLWLPEHFNRIRSAIDMLPADLNFEVSNQSEPHFLDQELASSRSGLSQRLDDHSLADERVIPVSQPSVQQITPDATIRSEPSNSGKKKRK